MSRSMAADRYDKAKERNGREAPGTTGEGRGRQGEKDGIMIMLRQQLFSCGEQLWAPKGMETEPAQEPLSGPLWQSDTKETHLHENVCWKLADDN